LVGRNAIAAQRRQPLKEFAAAAHVLVGKARGESEKYSEQKESSADKRCSPIRSHIFNLRRKVHGENQMKRKTIKMIALACFALTLALGAARQAQAQDAKEPYPSMASLDQYLMDRDAEIAMARSAAPESISRDADVLVLGSHGYETAVKGTNGFVCAVERGWMGPFEGNFTDGFWNPKLRGPICYNPLAVRSILPITYKRTEMVLAGQSKAQIFEAMKAFVKQGMPPLEPGAMAYMMSKEQYLNDSTHHHNWIGHLLYAPFIDSSAWDADMPRTPVMLNPQFHGDPEPIDVFMVPASWWSDGTADPVKSD
jgi:hypothetical protein